MKTSGNTVLITGGATGIGFALAEAFSEGGNEVIICGRRDEKLREAKQRIPKIVFKKCDISNQQELRSLIDWVTSSFPEINILVNNAGIQRAIDLKKGIGNLLKNEDEITIKPDISNLLGCLFCAGISEKTARISHSQCVFWSCIRTACEIPNLLCNQSRHPFIYAISQRAAQRHSYQNL